MLQNRFYVESKLRTDLNQELRKLFVTIVAEKHVPTLIRKWRSVFLPTLVWLMEIVFLIPSFKLLIKGKVWWHQNIRK